MIPFHEFVGQDITWLQPAPPVRAYELRVGAAVLAILRWHEPAGVLATATAADGRWVFNRELRPRSYIAVQAASADVAIFEHGWEGGVLRFADGRSFRWGCNSLTMRSEWVDEGPILRIVAKPGFPPAAGHLVIEPPAAARPELELLALLGWHLMLLAGDPWPCTSGTA
ncbi:MAG TPA: hypothetical protein VFU22_13185 [Roseiflexaceae bacterium]|nr:hypothetical protein [Roseiflexaceae bacterium]